MKNILTTASNFAKAIIPVVTLLGMIYAASWSIGVAPVTKSQAETIASQEVDKKIHELEDELVRQRLSNDSLADKINDLEKQYQRIDERTLRNIQIQDKILEEIRRLN